LADILAISYAQYPWNRLTRLARFSENFPALARCLKTSPCPAYSIIINTRVESWNQPYNRIIFGCLTTQLRYDSSKYQVYLNGFMICNQHNQTDDPPQSPFGPESVIRKLQYDLSQDISIPVGNLLLVSLVPSRLFQSDLLG
jgi:hypothetical protein